MSKDDLELNRIIEQTINVLIEKEKDKPEEVTRNQEQADQAVLRDARHFFDVTRYGL